MAEPVPMGQDLTWAGIMDADDETGDECVERAVVPFDGERPWNWATGTWSALMNLVEEAKGVASKPVVQFVQKYLKGTKLIFVVGQSGTGKSTLISEISGMNLLIGKTRKSGTKNHQVCPAIIDGEQYLFIDTPGFGAADMDDMDCFCDIVACLDALSPFVIIAGLIFVTGGNQERLTAAEVKTIQWIKCFCGPKFYRYITIMTSKWDKISEDDFEETWESMLSMLEDDPTVSEILNPPPVPNGSTQYHGGHIYHHGVVVDEDHPSVPLYRLTTRRHQKERADMATAMIKARYNKAPGVKLQVVREMDKKIPWNDTEAAKVLKHNPSHIKLDIRDGILQVFVKSLGDGTPKDKEPSCVAGVNIRTEYIRPAPDDRRKTASELISTWLGNLFPWLEIAKEAAMFFLNAQNPGNSQGLG
ncbi:P-loop containing nucleoside triphosphate hydrolase protein [Ustulina deusta]|nr:P-loop containing nucleoside triphosphate hydrolase protein [Ustulina deusta]